MKRLLTSVICGLVGINSVIHAVPSRPHLVVGIMVDQLRTDYIEFLQGYFGDKGFRKFINDGLFLKDVNYKVEGLDRVSGTAIVYTGNYPRYNGITSEKVYDIAKKEIVPVLQDPNEIGNFTTETFSPANLRLSTISDEIAIADRGQGAIYSIAADPQQAIVMAGHAGSSAAWINNYTGKWATTTYYRETPQSLTSRNYSNPITSRLDTMQWRPLLPPTAYPAVSMQKMQDSFRHTFPLSDRSVYEMFAASPMVNTEVTDVAISYLENLHLGNSASKMDMLNIGYTVAPFKYGDDADVSLELQDSYLRLDRELSRLLEAIEKYVGLDNTLIYMASTGYFDDAMADDAKYRIPSGHFSVKRALSLLNSYLSAHYGMGSYVDTFAGNHLYLNRKEIEDKNLNLREVAELSRDFLVRMSGVNDAFTMADIMTSSLPSMEALRLGTDPKSSGDVVMEFNPGWTIVDDTRFPNETKVVRSDIALTPAFILGKDVTPGVIGTPVDATAIAPTLSRILRIRSPNGAVSKSAISIRN